MLMVVMILGAACHRGEADEPASKGQEPRKVEEAARSKDAALKAADKYLVLLDKGKYSESWEASAEDLRRGLSRRKWIDALTKTRKPFGKPERRKLNRIEMKPGENPQRIDHAWVYSDVLFETGEARGELVVVYLERGKDWRVAGYFVGEPETFPKPPAGEKQEKPAEK